MLAKKGNIDEHEITRSFRGLYHCYSNGKGKVVGWLMSVVMMYISTYRKGLQYIEQAIQVLKFSIAHYVITLLVSCIFVIGGWERLQCLYWKFHYT